MNTSQLRILIAEDQESLREALVAVIEDEGYQVSSAQNGTEAWALMNANHYDLLIADLYMPELGGMDLAIRSQEHFPLTKILLTSGGGREVEAVHGKGKVKIRDEEIIVDMFLKKPYDIDELFSIIEGFLKK